MEFTTYKTATGEIIGNGYSSSVTNINQIACNSDETVIEGIYDQSLYTVTEGVAVSKPGPTVVDYIRAQRSFLLTESDWTQTIDSPLSDSKKAEWVTYRQALRDLPITQSSAATEDDIIFPTIPS
tara:strand:+ start:250 stop:624 length:375 start_codon:yes stop_codon:yes gene_type:complete